MSRYDGLIIPRSYSEYINKTDAATLQQALQLSGVLSDAVTANDNKAIKSGAVYSALTNWEKINNRITYNSQYIANINRLSFWENKDKNVFINGFFEVTAEIPIQTVMFELPKQGIDTTNSFYIFIQSIDNLAVRHIRVNFISGVIMTDSVSIGVGTWLVSSMAYITQ